MNFYPTAVKPNHKCCSTSVPSQSPNIIHDNIAISLHNSCFLATYNPVKDKHPISKDNAFNNYQRAVKNLCEVTEKSDKNFSLQ